MERNGLTLAVEKTGIIPLRGPEIRPSKSPDFRPKNKLEEDIELSWSNTG